MKIEEMFGFLINDYKLSYKYQEFIGCYGKDWTVQTHSFYNSSGCFTIYIEVQRGMEFWCSSRFSTEREELCERPVYISLIEPQVWEHFGKLGIFKNPFAWWNDNKVLMTLAKALKMHLAKNNEFLGIRIENAYVSG